MASGLSPLIVPLTLYFHRDLRMFNAKIKQCYNMILILRIKGICTLNKSNYADSYTYRYQVYCYRYLAR